MGTQKKTLPFAGTKEQEAKLLSVIAELKNEKGALMPILQKAQDIMVIFLLKFKKLLRMN